MADQNRRRHRRGWTARRVLAVAGALAVVGAAVPVVADAALSHSARTLTVAADGSGRYRTVQAAIDAAAPGDIVSIAGGTYHEVVKVPSDKTGLTVKGATGNPEDVVISYGNASGTAAPGGGKLGTMGSATASFAAAGTTVSDLTVINTFDRAANRSAEGTQAVAVAAEGDRQVYRNDRIIGRQDTVLTWSPKATAQTRQYFVDDYIAGDVDFIFGNATAVFDHATIDAVDDGAAAGGVNGFLTAANTEASHKYGLLITDSTVRSTAKDGTYFLGRPWHPTASGVAQVVVRNTRLPAAVKTGTPWTDMGGFSWKSARFASYGNTRAGVAVSDGPQLADGQAADFTARKYLAGTDGWDPVGAGSSGTGVGPSGSSGSSGAVATGDTRNVREPVVPTAVCATVTSDLAMPGRTADAAEESAPPDTARLQKALDGCARSGSAPVAVRLKGADATRTAFLTGALTVHQGEVLVLDSNVTLYGSRNPSDYQVSGKPTCGTLSSSSGGCRPLITVAGADAGIEAVRAGDGSQGRIDGRGDQSILGTGTSWWQLATEAQKAGKNQNNPRLIQADDSDNFTLYHVDLLNSTNFHVVYNGGNGFTAWGVRIKTPATARNTDGIDPAGATNVTITDSFIMDGDDGIAIKAGSRASSNITVSGNHFYGTHGISIGSETTSGVSNVLFRDNTLTGTDSLGNTSGSSTGIRIKSSPANGGKVSDVSYLDTCLDTVRAPLVFDTHYSSGSGSGVPLFTGIVVNGVTATHSPSGAESTFVGLDSAHPLGLTLRNVNLDVTANTASYATVGAADSNLHLSGTGVSVTAVTGSGSAPRCTFPAYPAI
ncbi:pectinesterase family protein [Streptomyces sp. SP17BM10]|uniref:pectinesterase family protein n=1 Tax=Streptomyces sp. SP17BM10 TaxID=3002530 RepID=UPI002E75D6E4|nr:pectinesterase family protein [Streptomyces sp. SP17BM10]MEE1782128.1 pectinesterase family protein [Streptomyces sp. SP17BM10]